MRRQGAQPPAHWYGDAPVPAHAGVLAVLYGAITGARRWLYRRGLFRAHHVGVPVVVVGNISAGGTGKTPFAIALVRRLRMAGRSPGVASRGYGRTDPATPRWVEGGDDASQVGDEPLLIARQTGVKVRVDRDRVAAARALVDAGCDVIVCDDGLQHYRLARDVEVEVIDGRRRYGNARLLPAGPLREPPARGRACDFRVVNLAGGETAAAAHPAEPGFGEWPMRLRAGDARPLLGGRPRPLSAFAGQRVHAVAGIGHPQRFFTMLREAGIAVVPHAFPDHHAYVEEDFLFGSDLPVLMTEKDAVKCQALAGERFYAVPVEAELPEALWIALLDRLALADRVT
ncbi:MAG TPA: tetraacyldisaccharide 4'-kinase [Xanthomonadaceae bacterium]|nr:tetraacyldisaccharide 4'-kinase [Xanthomonadaceae bacterium]